MSLKDYQNHIRQLLENVFQSPSIREWASTMGLQLYSPIPDIAVGPFSLENNVSLSNMYDTLFDNNINTIRDLVILHLRNTNELPEETLNDNNEDVINNKLYELRGFNFNSRCFIAIEIENCVSRKHLMGGAINASVLGRIGIAVGFTEEKHRAFLNLYRYFQFLQNVSKPTFKTNNLLVISHLQLLETLEKVAYIKHNGRNNS